MTTIVLSIISITCAILSISLTLSAKKNGKRLEELRRFQNKRNNADDNSGERNE